MKKAATAVGEKAVVKGDIIGQNVDFLGTIKGDFYVKDTLSLKGGCVVDGALHIKRLQVELDARFDGTCQMISESDFDRLVGAAPAAAPQKPAAAPQPQPVQPK